MGMLTVYDVNATPVVIGNVRASEITTLYVNGGGSQWAVHADLAHSSGFFPAGASVSLTPLLASTALAQAQLDKFLVLLGNLDVNAL